MSLLQSLSEFLQSIFMSSSPEVKKRQALKKIELDLRDVRPVIFKNGLVQANFAEALRVLFENTKPIEHLLAHTICSDDINRNNRYAEQLLLTGFSDEEESILESLEYENLKAEVSKNRSVEQYCEKKRRDLEKIIKVLNSEEFLKIERIIDRILRFNDLCHYNFVTTLRIFDPNYNGFSRQYKPSFQAVAPNLLDNALCDLFYIIGEFELSTSLAKALMALIDLNTPASEAEQKKTALMENLTKIQGVMRQVCTKQNLLNLCRISKNNSELAPEIAKYSSSARQKYADFLQGKFVSDINRMKTEVKDENLFSEVRRVFGDVPLRQLRGYNMDINKYLQQANSDTFLWITPMEVIKSFLETYYSENIRTLLNDIVIEGFFNNPAYKTDFSSSVYSCNDCQSKLSEFESYFDQGGKFDEALIKSYIRDSHKDPKFAMSLKQLVEAANKESKQLIQWISTTMYDLYKKIAGILVDSKKPSPDTISNLRMLLTSSRNKDNTNLLEQQFPNWKIFLEIMKNYAIIGNVEIDS